MNPNLKTIEQSVIAEIETEQANIKLSLVRDCMNVEKFLFAHYPDTHKAIINDWYGVFSKYYDMEIEELEVELAILGAKASAAARALINWGGML